MAELVPITRKENFLARAAGNEGLVLEPITREEHFLQEIIDSGGGGGGGSITVDSKLSISSTNPVQNKVVTGAFFRAEDLLAAKADKTQERYLTAGDITLLPENNWFYEFANPMEKLVISMTQITTDSYIFAFRFHSGATATVLTMPSAITMPDGFECEANKTYEINVRDGYALVSEWPYTAGGAA